MATIFRALALASGILLLFPGTALAQGYPGKPIRMTTMEAMQ